MNLRSDLALMLSGYTAVPPCLLFRHADGLRLDGCITLLVQEGQNLALSSLAEAALDHYADLLVNRLRRAVSCPVEVYFPASTAALVQRFEDLVARMTLQQAMAVVPGAAPERIWLVHEAGALAPSELQLLMRLVGNFPGAGVRVVLLFGATAAGRKGFESPGRRFARWDIQPPSEEEATTMLAHARLAGGESVVSGLLGLLGRSPGSAFTAMTSDVPSSSPSSSESSSQQAFQSWQLADPDPSPVTVPVLAVPPLPASSALPTAAVKPAAQAMPGWLRWPTWLQVGSLGRPPIVRVRPVATARELLAAARTEPALDPLGLPPSLSSPEVESVLPVVQDVAAKPRRAAPLLERALVLVSRLPLWAARLSQLARSAGAQARGRLRRSAPISVARPGSLPAPDPVKTSPVVSTTAQELPPNSNGPRP
jgi:hypothetical protein